MSDRVAVTIEGGVADVRLNRPDKVNALDGAMFAALVEAGEALKADPSVRAVVLSGEGRGFCAGLDFSSFQAMAGGGAKADGGDRPAQDVAGGIGETSGRITHLGQQAAWVWTEVPVPVIAAVHGACLGGGLQVALGADIRIVAPDAKLAVLEVKWGLTPDMTATVILPRLVGLDVAKELTFTAKVISGEEAGRIGLATHVSADPRADALQLAADIAARSPHAVRGAKRLFDGIEARSTADQLALERKVIGSLIGTPNQVEAVMSGFENRAPVFADPAAGAAAQA